MYNTENIKDMADVCEEAHKLTLAECKAKRIFWVDINNEEDTEGYPPEAQEIFNKHYNAIISLTGL